MGEVLIWIGLVIVGCNAPAELTDEAAWDALSPEEARLPATVACAPGEAAV
jgi:hypothetical protein